MSTTTLMRDPAEGWATAGRGLAGGLGALLSGEATRQKAKMDAEQSLADTYYRNMMGNQAGANATKYDQEATGLRLTNEARQQPVDATLPQYMQLAQRLFQLTGDTNMERFANAGTSLQTQGIRDQAVENVDNLDLMNRLNTLAKPGETYMPFDPVGNTGGAVNRATGEGVVFDEVLRKLFGQESDAKVARDRGAANASNASAGKYTAEANQTNLETGILQKTGSKPGSGAEGSEGALSSTILRTLQIPALDAKGRPVRNPITGELETQTDQAALSNFYAWVAANNRRPTATAFAQWEAAGRPAGNKNPAPTQPAGTMSTQANAAALARAREAIAKGAPRDKVIERLRQNGIDPTGL